MKKNNGKKMATVGAAKTRTGSGSVVFVFQRDFRAEDNLGFVRAAEAARKSGSTLVTAFLADDRQLDAGLNPYRSERCVRLMAECLADLSRELLALGWPAVLVASLDCAADVLAGAGVRAREVHHNRDHTPYARERDARLRAALEAAGVAVVARAEPEYTLWTPGEVATQAGGAYKVYSPFVRACGEAPAPRPPGPRPPRGPPRGPKGSKGPKGPKGPKGSTGPGLGRATLDSLVLGPLSPAQASFARDYASALAGTFPAMPATNSTNSKTAKAASAASSSSDAKSDINATRQRKASARSADAPSWRKRALAVLREVAAGGFDGYDKTRDDFAGWPENAEWPENAGTTGLSVPMKFGAVSCREVFAAFRRSPGLSSELMWREFYAHLAAGVPTVLAGQLDPRRGPELNRHERADRDAVLDRWRHGARERADLERWERGETGEPLVDAAMRQLRLTGRLHNRLRMVVASHLVKAMGVDWRRGEQVFARLLVDYDPCSNGGGWRAMDAQAPGREIRADSQARRRDPRGEYVERWGEE